MLFNDKFVNIPCQIMNDIFPSLWASISICLEVYMKEENYF